MVQDLAQLEHDERLLIEMEGEKLTESKTNHDAALHLELEGQCAYDSEIHQLEDDVLYHEDALIEETIAQFENLRSSDDDSYFGNDSPVNEFNEARAWWDEPLASNEEDEHEPGNDLGTWNAKQRPHKALNDTEVDNASDDCEVNNLDDDSAIDDMDNDSDDINENTDTEDGAEDIVGLIQANMQLLNFLTKQRGTIARLRARVSRLNTVIQGLTARLGDPNPMTTNRTSDPDHLLRHAPRLALRSPMRDMPHEPPPYPNPTVPGGGDYASVLWDTKDDMSFLLTPNCEPKVDLTCLNHTEIRQQLAVQLAKIKENKNSKEELWMYFDSGASRSVISTTSPLRQHLQATGPAYGSCSIGDGSPLHYLEKGHVKDNLEFTVVDGLKFDLFSSVRAAKQGLTSVIDYNVETGENNSFTIDKTTGTVTPLVERGKGILEIPIHMMLPAKACVSVAPNPTTQDALPPHVVSTFWHCFDDKSFDFSTRDNNKTDYALFAFDIIKSLNPRERDFLIHARLGHLPRKKILQMIKNKTTGISDYSGKFKELCKPCFQAKTTR